LLLLCVCIFAIITELPGILEVNTSYANGNAIIEFDKTKTSAKEIK